MLHGDEVGADERNVVDLTEHLNNTSVVDTWDQRGQQVSEKSRLLLQVERKRLVVAASKCQ